MDHDRDTPEAEQAFEEQYDVLRHALYPRCFTLLCLSYGVLACALLVAFLMQAQDSWWSTGAGWMWLRIAGFGAALAILSVVLLLRRRCLKDPERVATLFTLLIVIVGTMVVLPRIPVARAVDNNASYLAWGLLDLALLHVVGALLLPWRPRETLTPFALLLALWWAAIVSPLCPWDFMTKAMTVIISPIALLPGFGISWWKYRRAQDLFDRQMLGRKVKRFGGELSRARIVHDAMFPRQLNLGSVRFTYDYQPIQEIGGDYVHLHQCRETERVTVTLLDVAGHGLAAALTVNRLFGELERIRAETPQAEPAEVMELLNRYINLTMAPHSMFATGACFMLDPRNGTLLWVNAGHPPAYLRRGDGRVEELSITTIMLGVETYAAFDPDQQSAQLHPGDTMIAYTDGVIEARGVDGAQFGFSRLRETLSFRPAPRSWPRFIAGAVAKHHRGKPEDDLLVVELALEGLHIGAALPNEAGSPARTDPTPAEARAEIRH